MDYKLVPSVCSYCGTGCGLLYRVVNGKITGTWPMKSHPVNQGKLCIKGWNMHQFINSDIRLKFPLIKLNGH
ncbi:MAG TPA: formate dehydrogenase subunit alpha, partial [Desulfohalobiaceae bacterium]|nr:formate dehydrogenase subunit alpha [Desulfohalobiaceae bacterium]